jgi:peptidyl-prolyl cis-trans isomerase D
VKKGIAVSEDDLRKYYAENEKRYTTPEERRTSHILVKADKDAPKAEREKARAKAETLLAEVRKNPQSFAEIARKNSDDEGSASKGGDLDFFGRGQMVKPFEDAAFALKPGETSGIVESDFGYHIIQVTGARGGEKKSFEAVRGEIENEVRNQLVQKRFADAAVEFGDIVYEQPDSLKPAADKWHLDIRTAQHVTRAPSPAASGALASPRFLEALFSTESTRDKKNTKAIDVGANQLAAGRVVQYSPAHLLAFADVKDRVRQMLAAKRAGELATKLGTERLAKLQANPNEPFAGQPVLVSRAQPRDLPRPLLDAAIKAPVAKLPAFVGVSLGDQGYAIAKIVKTAGRDPVVSDATKAMAQYAQVWAEAEAQAYYTALKSRFKVSVNEAALAHDAAASEPR